MPIASPDMYRMMLDMAKARHFAYPAVNVSSSETINAALAGFVAARSDGILEISTGAAAFAAGTDAADADMALGAIALAEFAHRVAERYDIWIALHTDHCPPDKLNRFIRPLLAETRARRQRGQGPLFQSHMFDGSALPLQQNLAIAADLLADCAALDVILELEVGSVGGEEDGSARRDTPQATLYTTPQDMLAVAERLGTGERGRYLLAATFGNVHGVYQPGHVQLRPSILRDGQAAVTARYGPQATFDLVFHGGSGSALEEIRLAVQYGVVKMNVDSDMQYAFTRTIADHMFHRYDAVLRVDGGVGDKTAYDPRTYLRCAQASMSARVAQACRDLASAGQTLAGRSLSPAR